MTNQNIFDMVRFRTNTNSNTVTNANLMLSLNERHRQLWLALQDTREDYGGEISTTNMIQGQQEYPMPDDCMKPKRVELSYDGTIWHWAPFFDVNTRQRANDATTVASDFSPDVPYVDIHESSFFLYPTPDTNNMKGIVTGVNQIKLWYIKRPQDMTLTTQIPILPKEHHIWIVDLMSVDVEVSRGRIAVTEALEQENSIMQMFKIRVAPRAQGEKVRMQSLYQNNR